MKRTKTLLQLTHVQKLRVPKLLCLIVSFYFSTALSPALWAQSSRPVITSFTPTSGSVGTTVTISGNNFGATSTQNAVYFGAAKANVISATSSALTIQVPAGATLAPISVTANNRTGTSSGEFRVTFAADPVTSGSFGTIKDLTPGDRSFYSSIFGDFDGDGKLDLLGVDFTSTPNLSVRKNTSTPGNISYGETKTFPTKEWGVPALADLNGDGKLDLALLPTFSSTFYAIKNVSEQDSIAFATDKPIIIPNIYYVAAIGDIDNDGKPDLISANDSVFSFNKNTSTSSDISFAPKISVPLLANIAETDNYIKHLWIKDFDGDGKQDIIASTTTFVYVVPNISTGGNVAFGTPIKLNSTEIYGNSYSEELLTIGDVNNDGKQDIVLNMGALRKLDYFENNSSAGKVSFAAPRALEPPPGYSPTMTLYPLSGSGLLDFISSDASFTRDYDGNVIATTYDLYLYPQHRSVINGKKTFSYPDKTNIYSSNSYNLFNFKDLDGDSKPDLILYSVGFYSSMANPRVLKNQSGAATAPPVISAVTPDSIYVNDTIFIHGKNFTGVNVVRFADSLVKSFSILSDTVISAVVLWAPGNLIVQSSAGNDTFPPIKISYVPYIKTNPGDIPIACYPASTTFTVDIPEFYKSDDYYYSWFKNGVRVGDRNRPYSPKLLEKGDSIWSVLIRKRQTAVIAKSNVVHITTIKKSYHPTIYIKANKTVYCEGETATFKATVINPGTNPKFLWIKNNVLVGDSSNIYKDPNLHNNDTVYCILYEPEGPCVPEYLRSQPIYVKVINNNPVPITAISGPSSVTAGQQVTFSVPEDSTSTFRWPIPGGASIVSGNGTNAIIVNWGNSAGKISVKATNACGSSPVISKLVTIASNSNAAARMTGNINEDVVDKISLSVYPNPASSQTNVSFTAPVNGKYTMFITDAQGRTLQTHKLELLKGSVNKKISTASYAPGIYYITITDNSKQTISKQLLIGR